MLTLYKYKKLFYLIIFFISGISLNSCTLPTVPWTGASIEADKLEVKNLPPPKEDAADYNLWENRIYRSRGKLPENINQNEGSLWESGASWGDIFRDKKARFKGDILQINNLNSTNRNNTTESEDNKLNEEISNIESKIQTIVAEVSGVMPNGNLILYGRKITLQSNNQVRFVTTVRGYARVSDINGNNIIDASKIYNLDFQTTKGLKKSSLVDFYETQKNPSLTVANTTSTNQQNDKAILSDNEQTDVRVGTQRTNN